MSQNEPVPQLRRIDEKYLEICDITKYHHSINISIDAIYIDGSDDGTDGVSEVAQALT